MTSPEIKALSLKDIIQFELPALFRRQHLNRDVIIGLIGDRGDGKSLGGGVISILDFMLQNEPCWSNMQIAARFNVDADTAEKYGLSPGSADFESNELDMQKFLHFHPDYHDGLFYIDEINIALADARRAMASQNLAADDVGQQLRKLRSGLIYTCIHEMFVDNRIRDLTDIFIQCRDTALSPEGLASKKKPGYEFSWEIYPMSRKLTGERYTETHQSFGPIYLDGHQWWGAIDTEKRQDRAKYKISAGGVQRIEAEIEIHENPAVVAAKSKWGWLYEAIRKLHYDGYEEIHNKELWDYLNVDERGISTRQIGEQLSIMGIRKRAAPLSIGGYYYLIDQFDLKKGTLKERKTAVLV